MKILFRVCFLALPLCLSVSAAGNADLEELARTYKMSKEEFLVNEAQKRRILASLYQINRHVKNISKQKTILTDELLVTQSRIQLLSRNIVKLEDLSGQQRGRLKQRLRTLYKFSGEGYLKGLFANSTVPELDRFLKFMKKISERDDLLIREYQRNIKNYQVQKDRLTKETQRLIALKGKIRSQENKLSSENSNTQKLLAQIDATRLNQLTRLRSLRTKTQSLATSGERVDEALLKMMEPSFFEQKGQLVWPVAGSIGQRFGYITDETYQYRISHKGLFFEAPQKIPVSSCFHGTVAYVGEIEGYGQTLILDHGHHYYTVYGNVSDVLVKMGDRVEQNQKIAKTIWSSEYKKAGLYFEVRHFSEPEDPASWLRGSGVQVSKNEYE